MSTDGTARLLVVVAHPDDESFGCGSLLAYAAARGVATTVCCATRGEAGEDSRGLADGVSLGEVREQELRHAASLLGVHDVRLFDWFDSGMVGEPVPGSLADARLNEVSDAVAGVIEQVRPTVVITLDGSDGHRDHARIRDATLTAVDRTEWQPERTYLSCLARSNMQRWVEHLSAANPGSDYLELGQLGTPDEQITTVIDTSAVYDLRWRAIRAHASQTSPFEIMPPDLQRAFLATDRLRQVRPPWEGTTVESDIF